MVQLAAVLLRGVIATFVGLLLAGGTLTLAADRVPVSRPTLVAVGPEAGLLVVPDVTGQAYVFAKGILQDHGFAWHVAGPVQGYAANKVAGQQPTVGTTVIDTGAPTLTLTLSRNASYVEHGTPENDAPYPGTAIRLPASVPGLDRPRSAVQPRLEPVPVPIAPLAPGAFPVTSAPSPLPAQAVDPVQTPGPDPTEMPVPTGVVPVAPPTTAPAPVTTAPAPTPTPSVFSGPRRPDFAVAGAPKEPAKSAALPDRAAELGSWLESHRDPSAVNINHWLYEHAYIVAGARFGWWHGTDALRALIEVDRRAETLWGVGRQSRMTAEKALAEVQARSR